ncbi:hypothetical protein [Aliarcobacter butzleri]|uniref:hypothetical protein n=1 Tax=Aliarcobacter butzleri TaxID=28197 RepID=UPI00214C6ED9|nr:hypothetical protein [Aliarcobacter butzleri]MCP3649695.1 hypothetical protein [Arcobacter sp. DNRA7]MCR1815868.1 hypothetical protein [Aliarcobacter butzleri]
MDELEHIRTIRVTKINPFLLSNGIILKGSFIIFFILTFQFIFSLILFRDYYFYTYKEKDILETLNQVGGDIFIIQRFFILHYIDNLIIRTFNSYISDLKDISVIIPYFHEYINYNKFNLTFIRYLEMFLSFILTFLVFLLTIIQIRDQQKFMTIGLQSIYSPLILIVFSHFDKEHFYFKRVRGIKSDTNFSKDKLESFIELFFNKSDLYLNNNLQDLELKIETKSYIFGFYNFYKVSIVKKSKKSK